MIVSYTYQIATVLNTSTEKSTPPLPPFSMTKTKNEEFWGTFGFQVLARIYHWLGGWGRGFHFTVNFVQDCSKKGNLTSLFYFTCHSWKWGYFPLLVMISEWNCSVPLPSAIDATFASEDPMLWKSSHLHDFPSIKIWAPYMCLTTKTTFTNKITFENHRSWLQLVNELFIRTWWLVFSAKSSRNS